MNDPSHLVIGLLNPNIGCSNDQVASKLRELTICWTRYGYQGEILERATIAELLESATERGYHYCFILPVGYVLFERWKTSGSDSRDFFESLEDWLEEMPVALAGTHVVVDTGRASFASPCVLVDVQQYQTWKGISLSPPCASSFPASALDELQLIERCIAAGHVVHEFPHAIAAYLLNLKGTEAQHQDTFAQLLGEGIAAFGEGEASRSADELARKWGRLLTEDQIQFLQSVAAQAANARKGIFLWNIESYADIEVPSIEFVGPVDSLYSVAAGFKPQRILSTHGVGPATRVVYFDYSQTALDVRRVLVEQWDGINFPNFVEYLFERFPAPAAYYQLWDGATPATVDRKEIAAMWQRELKRWGGEIAFREFWHTYRTLPHEYVHCNIIQDPSALMAAIRDEPNSVMWWSNAFFTMFGNWFYDAEARESAYRHWITQLAQDAPGLFLLGSDVNNSNVNGIRAAEYARLYDTSGCSNLVPLRAGGTIVRM